MCSCWKDLTWILRHLPGFCPKHKPREIPGCVLWTSTLCPSKSCQGDSKFCWWLARALPRIAVMGHMPLKSCPVLHREKDWFWLLRTLFKRKMESHARYHYRSHSDRDKWPWHIYVGSLTLSRGDDEASFRTFAHLSNKSARNVSLIFTRTFFPTFISFHSFNCSPLYQAT